MLASIGTTLLSLLSLLTDALVFVTPTAGVLHSSGTVEGLSVGVLSWIELLGPFLRITAMGKCPLECALGPSSAASSLKSGKRKGAFSCLLIIPVLRGPWSPHAKEGNWELYYQQV